MISSTVIKSAKAGDRDAFRTIVETCKSDLYGVAFGFTRNHQDAEDVLQEAFIKAYRFLPKFREESNLKTWLYRITLNTCLDLRKRKGRNLDMMPLLEEQDQEDEISTPFPDPERRIQDQDLAARIDDAVKGLSPLERSAFVLRHYRDLKIKEVAATLERSEGTIKNVLFRALRKMRDALEDYNPKPKGARP